MDEDQLSKMGLKWIACIESNKWIMIYAGANMKWNDTCVQIHHVLLNIAKNMTNFEILGIPIPIANAKKNAQSCLDRIALWRIWQNEERKNVKTKNIPAGALPAYENEENDYFVTACHSEERFFSLKTSPKKRSIYFVNNNPSMTSAWKRATATFSHIFFNVSAVASIRFLPVHSHRHWKERMHFHIWGLRAWPFFDSKLPGMASLRTFQNPSTWPVWILTFPLF